MRKLVMLLAVFAVFTLVLAGGAFAVMTTVVSDTNVEWSEDGIAGWQPAVACWVHGSWPSISDATWIWITYQVDWAAEYAYWASNPDPGWYFQKTFEIPGTPTAGVIEITADNAYTLEINNDPVGGDGAMDRDGPDYGEWSSIESFNHNTDFTLVTGSNTILVRAMNWFNWGPSTGNPAGLTFKLTIEYDPVIPVSVDIKPGSCPNPLNVTERGGRELNFVVPVAILGTELFDVTLIDVTTIGLEGVAQLRESYEDVATPYVDNGEDCYDCNDFGPDGYMDLTLKFPAQGVVDALGDPQDGDCVVVELTGELLDGTPFSGQDVVKIINKG